MLVTFKTLDHKIFKYEVSEEETVSDLKDRVEDDMGRENLYRLIYAGKILKDEEKVSSYKINPKQFVVLMITKSHKAAAVEQTSYKSNHESVKPVVDEQTTATTSSFNEDAKTLNEKSEGDIPDSSCCVGLDWVEKQIEEKERHFVTDRDFSIALEVVMSTDYLADRGAGLESSSELAALLEQDTEPGEVRSLVQRRLPDLLTVRPNPAQLEAFLADLSGIFSQERSREEVAGPPRQLEWEHSDEEEDSEDEAEVVVTAFDRNVDKIVAMGFVREEAEVALRAAYNNPVVAVEYLVGGELPAAAFAPEENPLAFLRDLEEFQHIRVLVQAKPSMLQSLLLAFGEKHPELMDSINKNKLSFVRMLHEPAGARGLGDDSALVVDPRGSRDGEAHGR